MILPESRIHQVLGAFAGRRIAVVGDVMLDRFFRGAVSRISPEAPVPVVDIEEESEHPGGASNVGFNLAMLGAKPLLLGVVGDDMAGSHLRALHDRLGIGSDGLVTDAGRPTTVKTRVIAQSQHIVRIDRETKRDVTEITERQILSILDERIGTLDAIILQDYNKGVVTRRLIHDVIEMARLRDVPVHVDPKFSNFFEYRGAHVFKPNRKEAEDALQRKLSSPIERRAGIEELLERLGCEHVILTLGPEGMLLGKRDEEPLPVPTRAIQVADVSGAGDTVIATLATAYAAGASMHESVVIANHAAGIVCGQIGTVPVEYPQLLEALIGDCEKEVEG